MSSWLSLSFTYPEHNHPYRNRESHEQIIFIDVISGDQEILSNGTRRFVIITKKPSNGFYSKPVHSNLHPQHAFL